MCSKLRLAGGMPKPIIAAGTFVFLAALGISPHAQAAMIAGGTDINIGNGYQCVEVAGGKTAPGTAVQSWDCWGGFNQQWNVWNNQILGIGSTASTYSCMDIAGTSAGSGVVINACSGAASQKWAVLSGRIESTSTKLCLDLGTAGYSNSGVQLTIEPCSNSLTQQFAIR